MQFATILALISAAGLSLAAPLSTSESLISRQVDSSANAIVDVEVGPNGMLVYSPPFLTGPIGAGQRIHFDFQPKNHTFTESTEWAPCHKNAAAGTFDTNFGNARATDADALKPFDITLADDSARFFYCKQENFTPEGHCHQGMVFAVNVDADRFAAYQARANEDGLVQ